jgi:hypothetical protein
MQRFREAAVQPHGAPWAGVAGVASHPPEFIEDYLKELDDLYAMRGGELYMNVVREHAKTYLAGPGSIDDRRRVVISACEEYFPLGSRETTLALAPTTLASVPTTLVSAPTTLVSAPTTLGLRVVLAPHPQPGPDEPLL